MVNDSTTAVRYLAPQLRGSGAAACALNDGSVPRAWSLVGSRSIARHCCARSQGIGDVRTRMYHSKSYLKNVRVLLTRAVQDSVRIAYRAAFRAQVEKHHGRRIGNAYQQGCSGSYAAVGQQARCCSSGTERPVSWFSPGGEVHFPGAVAAPYTHKLVVEEAAKLLPIPAFRLLNNNGELVDGVDSKSVEERVSGAVLRKIYDCMVALNVMDSILFSAQRQGRISFYLTSFCEEAAVVASAAALDNHDEVFAQYREQGVLLWRGYTYDDFCQQCCSTRKEPARGHQMPVHYGRKDMHFHTISSTLATQIPHAVGAAYALKLDGKGIAACYFGEGAASEGDFHAAMNFASTLDCPVLFICRNNGYAISTPATEQFRGDGIARRACGYGMDAIRCDGNDALAVYVATNYARDRIVATSRPMLLELLTYRGGHHSTSDDSSQYRSLEEIDYFMRYADPIARLGRFLNVSPAEEQAMRERERTLVLDALSSAEQEEKEPPLDMFLDVYSSMPPHLIRQRESLRLSLERIEQAKANRASTSPK